MSESRPEASSPAEGVGMVRWITKYPAMMNLYEGQRVGTITVQTGILSKLPGSPQLLPSLFRFRALQHGGTPFRLVREEDGEIRVGARTDHERLCAQNLNCSLEFDVW